jgi:phosphoribosylcarboxyaminoimidazole (NCAIR) mutase
MPKGIPVATVGVNAMENAAILAVRILSEKFSQKPIPMQMML